MSALRAEQRQAPEPVPVSARGLTTGQWAMLGFIAAESVIFVLLVFSYFLLRSHADQWPPAGVERPHLTQVWVMTALLLSSSIPVHWGERGIRKGKQMPLRIGFALGWILAAVFLVLTAIEWRDVEFTPSSHVYGSIFFAITGFHAVHVLGGLAISAFIQSAAWMGKYSARRHERVVNATLYWHFVDVVWIMVLGTIYLSPYFLS